MDLELGGKVAIVTGGSKGIGRAIARQLALEGMDVAIVARNRAALEGAAKELAAESGRRIVPLTADTSVTTQVNRMAEEAMAALGRVDVLVNNAALVGGVPGTDLATVDETALLGDINTKFLGYLRCVRAIAPHMKRQGWGRIINIGGGSYRQSATLAGARNAAVVHLTKVLSEMLGPYGITVNVIHPGVTSTGETGHLAEQARKQGLALDDLMKRTAANNATRRVVDAAEIGCIAAFLASPKAAAITGEGIVANGGNLKTVRY
jgi:NAD(P)-dependent dehydrogenase (short-subunit alcohol dehydrogenase family)